MYLHVETLFAKTVAFKVMTLELDAKHKHLFACAMKAHNLICACMGKCSMITGTK